MHAGRGDSWAAQLIRFALVGGSSNVVYVLSFLALPSVDPIVANAVGAATSTMLANELHRRRTFRAADRVHWLAAQWHGSVVAAAGLALSTTALTLLHRLVPAATGTAHALVAIGVTAVVGGLRFLILRATIFAPSSAATGF